MSDASERILLDDEQKDHAVKDVLRQAKALAVKYRELTGKPLGVTGEIAEYEAAKKLGLILTDARLPYFDAFRDFDGRREFFQIKGRAVKREDRYRGRVPTIRCDGEFDAVLLVLLDRSSFDVIEIWQAGREKVRARLEAPGSRSRNERGSMGISQFKSIADSIWPQPAQKEA